VVVASPMSPGRRTHRDAMTSFPDFVFQWRKSFSRSPLPLRPFLEHVSFFLIPVVFFSFPLYKVSSVLEAPSVRFRTTAFFPRPAFPEVLLLGEDTP